MQNREKQINWQNIFIKTKNSIDKFGLICASPMADLELWKQGWMLVLSQKHIDMGNTAKTEIWGDYSTTG
jgi:hypothetical protein